MARKVTDTSRQAKETPLATFLMAAVMGTSGMIEHQEKQGQQELVNSDVIPIKGSVGENEKILTAIGFKLDPLDPQDTLFRECTLPAGWKKKASDHDMWSYIYDEKDRERISIFYKAAFYDRSAHMSINRRYRTSTKYSTCETLDTVTEDFKKQTHKIACVVDFDGKVLHSVSGVGMQEYEKSRAADELVSAWLNEHFPDHANPAAYWND